MLHALLADFTTRPVLHFDQHSAIEFERLKRFWGARLGPPSLRYSLPLCAFALRIPIEWLHLSQSSKSASERKPSKSWLIMAELFPVQLLERVDLRTRGVLVFETRQNFIPPAVVGG